MPGEEVPAISTTASGRFNGEISRDELSISYTLSFSSLEGTVTQGSTPGEFAELVRAIRAGTTYANVHSVNAGGVTNTKFAGGEIRGQIRARGDSH